ncbi:GDSL-type esterase/lipase family protein [Paractinoplanes hotanensis]|uniref:GDSL-type esterase/lipase family protein n=1 Tax=Paractinoplanes hotanensis TaxID=2906497 RepID=A0ABT0YBP5_9ACTN|nr:GDSL-type esterase/lipase family protein [Actinoplanes hotanensis]MCM4083458.1 GDSL-type esterase/lipase family protein [Actinoplanes hotanensis]
MLRTLRQVLAAVTAVLVIPAVAGPAHAAADDLPWAGTWATAMQGTGPAVTDQTIRQIVHTSVGGPAVRVRLSNRFGPAPVTLADVHVAETLHTSDIVPGTSTRLTFDGSASVTIPAGGEVASDPATFAVAPDADVSVSFHVPGTAVATQHGAARQVNYAAPGNQSAAATLTGRQPRFSYVFLSGLDVRNPRVTGTVVAFGASITDGTSATENLNRRWPNRLATRLNDAGYQVGVLNQGISGNNLLRDGGGPAAVTRFQHDALDQPGVRWVIFSDDPINDINNYNPPVTLLTDGLSRLIAAAHARNVKFICSTLTPVKGLPSWTPAKEASRQAVNAFLRSPSSGCDGIVDQAAATGDPADPEMFRPAYDSGDHLHPNDAGLQAIADAVPLSLFGTPAGPAPISNPMVDDTGLTYDAGWRPSGNRGLGDWQDNIHFTSTAGAVAHHTFTGTGAELWAETNGDGGTMDIYVDDVFRSTVDLRSTGPRQVRQVVFRSTGLAHGTHTIRIVSGTAGRIAMVDALRILSDRTVNDTGAEYDSGWRHPAGRGLGDVDDDVHYTLVPGSTAEFFFYGTDIHLLSERNGDEGTMDVSIDGGPATVVDLHTTGARQVRQTVFTATGLNPTQRHRMTIVSTAAVPRIGMIDAFQVISR